MHRAPSSAHGSERKISLGLLHNARMPLEVDTPSVSRDQARLAPHVTSTMISSILTRNEFRSPHSQHSDLIGTFQK